MTNQPKQIIKRKNTKPLSKKQKIIIALTVILIGLVLGAIIGQIYKQTEDKRQQAVKEEKEAYDNKINKIIKESSNYKNEKEKKQSIEKIEETLKVEKTKLSISQKNNLISEKYMLSDQSQRKEMFEQTIKSDFQDIDTASLLYVMAGVQYESKNLYQAYKKIIPIYEKCQTISCQVTLGEIKTNYNIVKAQVEAKIKTEKSQD